MTRRTFTATALLLACLALPSTTFAAEPPDVAARLEPQRQAMRPLALLDGTWRGPAFVTLPDGRKRELVQTERVGSFLGGSIKVIEGRGHGPDGSIEFNAFAIVSFSPQTGRYGFRSYAQGYAGDYAFEVRPDGFAWTLQAGAATVRHTAVIRDGRWTEIGERLVDGQPPQRIFEMTLQRLGDTDWPAGGAVGSR
jgi:hypothetical protein